MVGDTDELKEADRLLVIYGPQKFEPQPDIKEVVTTPESAPRDQDSDDDLREQNRFLQGKLQAMEAAKRDAGKTSKEPIMFAQS